jgi:hypothetical protein
METKITTPVIKGIIISLILIVYSLVIYFTNQIGNQALSYLQMTIFLIGIIWSCIIYSKQMNANVTFGNLFSHGFKTAVTVIAIIVIYTVLSMTVLFPEMVDKGTQIARQKMEASGKLSDSQIDQQLDFYKDHALLLTLASVIIFMAIVGLIAALIGAAVAKKKPQGPFGNQPM